MLLSFIQTVSHQELGFLLMLNAIPLRICLCFCINSAIERHLGCLEVLDLISKDLGNILLQLFLRMRLFNLTKVKNENVDLKGRYLLNFIRNCPTCTKYWYPFTSPPGQREFSLFIVQHLYFPPPTRCVILFYLAFKNNFFMDNFIEYLFSTYRWFIYFPSNVPAQISLIYLWLFFLIIGLK